MSSSSWVSWQLNTDKEPKLMLVSLSVVKASWMMEILWFFLLMNVVNHCVSAFITSEGKPRAEQHAEQWKIKKEFQTLKIRASFAEPRLK